MPSRLLLLLALLIAATLARAQSPIVGGQVFLNQPGSITATLLASPTSFDWKTGVLYTSVLGVPSGFNFFNAGTTAMGITTSTTPVMPSQGGTPLIFLMAYVPPVLPSGNDPHNYVTTGFAAGDPRFATPNAYQTAGVLFGPNNTAQIGFAPVGTSARSFLDYPIRFGVTNVSSRPFGGGSGGIGGGGC
jgi:hypothetical protein